MSLHHTGRQERPEHLALTLVSRLHTMEPSRMRRVARSPDEPTSLLRPTTQALEAAAPHLRPACPRGSAAGQRLRHRSVATEAAAGAVSQCSEPELPPSD